ncbi:MAG: DUF1553 domain-containing protein, partial [Planctomycetales bacterium]
MSTMLARLRFVPLLLFSVPLLSAAEPTSQAVSYYKQIRPIFQANCQGCHQPAKPGGEYVMTSFKALLQGGESEAAAVTPKQPDESYLMELITPEKGEAEMPKDKKPLFKIEIDLIKQWISEGAHDDTPPNSKIQYDQQNPPVYTLPPVVTSLDYSPDGKLLAVSGFHEVLLHNADGSGLVARLVGMSERIESVRFSPDGKLLAVTGGLPARMGEVQVWDVAKHSLKLSHSVTFDTVYGASWSPDGTRIAFGCADNTVRAIELKTGKQVFYQGSHDDWVFDTVFSVKGTHLISVGRDRTAKLTEFATQRFMDNITSITPGALQGGVAAVTRHPAKDEILVGGADGVPKAYRVFRTSKRVIGDDANLLRKYPPLKGRIFGLDASLDGKRIVAGSSLDGSGHVRVFNNDDAKPVSEIEIAEAGIYAVSFSPDAKIVAAAGTDGFVRLINADNGQLIKKFLPVELKERGPRDEPRKIVLNKPVVEVPQDLIPQGRKLVGLEITPSVVRLNNPFEAAQLLVTGKLDSGDLVDLTRGVIPQGAEKLVDVAQDGQVRPLQNGRGELIVSHGGQVAKAAVEITGFATDHPVSFVQDVMPMLSKLGCNAGTCHGAREGRDGFKLSLRGYDPLYDFRALTDDLNARRVNLASASDSLMLLKSVSEVPHEGGQVTRTGERAYELMRKWIADGVKLDLDAPRVTGITIQPSNPVVQKAGGTQQMRIVATFADGKTRDVTSETFISSGDTEVAVGDAKGIVSAVRRGEAPILARYQGAYAATILTVMGDRSGFAWKAPPANNYIDELVAVKLQRMKILPSELCADDEFLRRAYLDLTGLPPSAEDVRRFLADERETRVKREEVIDKLVGGKDYVQHWTNKWADLLQVNRKFLAPEGAKAFRGWIQNEVASNTPYDQFVVKLLSANGSNRENPAASYFKILREPDAMMENTTHLFLGVRFSCNKCHDHPFERWTQDQYYETAAFFAQVGLKKDPKGGKKEIGKTAVEKGKPLYEIVYEKDSGEVKHVRTGDVIAPAFPFAVEHETPEGATRRMQLTHWLTSPANPYFARSFVNRMWGYLTGAGLIEPVDDIRAGNPPTNPELLDRLAQEFIQGGFNVQHLVRDICKSRTYQLSIKTNSWNEDDRVNYSHALARRLSAEVLFDAVHKVTGSISKIPGVAPGMRAAELPDAGVTLPGGFLANLGRPVRESACECERSSNLSLGPVMALINGATIGNAVSDPKNELAKLVAAKTDDAEVINEVFTRILNRPATDREIDAAIQLFRTMPDEHDQLAKTLDDMEKQH